VKSAPIRRSSGRQSRALRSALGRTEASIEIWLADESLAVEHVTVTAAPVQEFQLGDWRMCVDEELLRKVLTIRRDKLPNETAGVLLGSFDPERRIVYVIETILIT